MSLASMSALRATRGLVAKLLTSLILCIALPLLVKAENRGAGAYVLSVRGDWIAEVQSSVPLKRGAVLAPGTEIRPRRRASADDFIVLVDTDNRVIQKRCSVDRCNEPLRIARPATPSAFSEVLTAVSELWRKDEQRYRSLLSRGSSLPETVLELNGNSLNVSPVLAGLRKQRYRMQLEPLRSTPPGRPLEFGFDYDPAQPADVDASGLAPGLYSLRLTESNPPSVVPLSEKAWVLVVRSAAFEQVNSRFQFAQNQALIWKETADPSVVKSFLRAYLEYLADNARQDR